MKEGKWILEGESRKSVEREEEGRARGGGQERDGASRRRERGQR